MSTATEPTLLDVINEIGLEIGDVTFRDDVVDWKDRRSLYRAVLVAFAEAAEDEGFQLLSLDNAEALPIPSRNLSVGSNPEKIIRVSIYGHETDCRLLEEHAAGTIDVQRIEDGRCFRLSGYSSCDAE